MENSEIKNKLDHFADRFNQPGFIQDDPILVPHSYSSRQNIEIAALISAIFAWGQRKTIIKSSRRFLELMGEDPYDFAVNHRPKDRIAFENFKHRTFQPSDAVAFLQFLQSYYSSNHSLETLFASGNNENQKVESGLENFHKTFMLLSGALPRTRKHIARPSGNSTCKRLNMFLRWMVRKDERGVDFGLWNKIDPSELFIPFDLHVERIARRLNLLERKQRDWKTVVALTEKLKTFDPKDPVKYDFALFGMSISEKEGPLS
ncbi:MAG: TIGR02757 family protein [Saprospirales bacterium]|nr:MAG: TIGR02757 family protein [Saprospirales bacterium]